MSHGHNRMLAAALLLAMTGCEAGTGGKAVNFNMALVPVPGDDDESLFRFVNDEGWTIQLDEAWLMLGPIYLWENPTNFSVVAQRSPLTPLTDWLIPSAHAHAGDVFFSGGTVYGEYRQQVLFDALGDTQELGTVDGVEGRARTFSMELSFPQNATPGASVLDGHQAILTGSASKEGENVRFGGAFDYPGNQLDRTINEVGIDAAVTDFGRFEIAVTPSAFFRGADFSRIDPETATLDGTGRVWIDPADQPHVQMKRGLQRSSSYRGSWTP